MISVAKEVLVEYNIEWHDILTGTGSAYAVSQELPEFDPVQALHNVVREVTGHDPSPPPRRIGFY